MNKLFILTFCFFAVTTMAFSAWALTAGHDIDIGSTIIANDEENLYVGFNTPGSWALGNTYVHVGISENDYPQFYPYGGNTIMAFDSFVWPIGVAGLQTLTAGHDIDIGSTIIANDEENLYVGFNTPGSWAPGCIIPSSFYPLSTNFIGGDEPWENRFGFGYGQSFIGGDEPWENRFGQMNTWFGNFYLMDYGMSNWDTILYKY